MPRDQALRNVQELIRLPVTLELAGEHCTVIDATLQQVELQGHEEQPPGAASVPACSEPGYLLQYKGDPR